MARHYDAVEAHHRFSGVTYLGTPWELAHLDAFALRIDPGIKRELDVVVLFSCHCFTKPFASDSRARALIPAGELYNNGREERVLCPKRYALSQRFLPQLVKELPTRTIQFAGQDPLNFVTLELLDETGKELGPYAVFFEVTKDSKRRGRLLLHVQSAYHLEVLTQRQAKAGKVKFDTLLRAAFEGRKIKG